MNPYYATGFMTGLVFWAWPALLFKNLNVHWTVAVGCALLIFLGVGRLASEFHIRVVAPKNPPKGSPLHIGLTCAAIVVVGLLTRVIHAFV